MEADKCASASHPLPVLARVFNSFGGKADKPHVFQVGRHWRNLEDQSLLPAIFQRLSRVHSAKLEDWRIAPPFSFEVFGGRGFALPNSLVPNPYSLIAFYPNVYAGCNNVSTSGEVSWLDGLRGIFRVISADRGFALPIP